jgi:hypothetical protein
VFARFNLSDVETTYTIGLASAGAGKRVGELVVRLRSDGGIGWGKPLADIAEISQKASFSARRGRAVFHSAASFAFKYNDVFERSRYITT